MFHSATATVVERGKVATVGYHRCHPPLPGSEQISDGALTIIFELMKALCGPQWRPQEANLARRRPADVAAYRTQFGELVRFDAEESALSFAAHWLDCKVSEADPELHYWHRERFPGDAF